MPDDRAGSNPYRAPTTCGEQDASASHGREKEERRLRWRTYAVIPACMYGGLELILSVILAAMNTWHTLAHGDANAFEFNAYDAARCFVIAGWLMLCGAALLVAARCLWKGRWVWGWLAAATAFAMHIALWRIDDWLFLAFD